VRFLQFIATTWLMLLCAVASAHAEKRVALVVGNGAYSHADRLANPVNDARGMRAALAKLGFDVIYGEDLGQKALRRAIGQFADRVEGADVAMVYFAGHGATFGDTPYVAPVDAEFSSLGQVPYELVPVETLIGELRQAKGVRIAILDACRDNVAEQALKRQASRGGAVTRGLAPISNPSGLIIAYATQYLSTAADDAGTAGGHSPFTAALLKNIATPGVDVTDMLRKVGREVDAATGGKQRPEISISIYDQFVLAPAVVMPAVPTPPAGSAGVSEAAQAWGAVQNTTSLAVIDEFIRQFGNTPIYGALARARREELVKESTKPAAGQQIAVVAPPATPAVSVDNPCTGPVTVAFPSRCAAPLTAAQERALKPKDSFKECAECPEMVVVPAGNFTMGSPASEKGHQPNEGPQHRVTFDRQFAVGKYAVTFDEWDACVADGGCNGDRPLDHGWGRGRRPVIGVFWDEAKGYVAWLSRKTGRTYRLMSEAEREYITRAGTTTPFWWGSTISTQQANYQREYRDRTMPVDSFQPNPWGLYQVHGNVADWTEDCYHQSYNGAPGDGSAWTGGDCSQRVYRGGDWGSLPQFVRAAARSGTIITGYGSTGFRLARTLIP
jgi:formylglycine-generating enzyme required for sulfatase activity